MEQIAAVSVSRITPGYKGVMRMDKAPVVAGKQNVTPLILTAQAVFHHRYL